MDVKDCMSKNVCCCTPETNISDVAKLMCDNHVGCIPVCDTNNCVVGVLTDRDVILRTISCNKDAKTTKASDDKKKKQKPAARRFLDEHIPNH